MKGLIEEYGKTILYIMTGILLLSIVIFTFNQNFSPNITTQLQAVDTPLPNTNSDYVSLARPFLELDESIKLESGDIFDVIDTPSVQALNGAGDSILSDLLVYGAIGDITYDGDDWKLRRSITVYQEGVFTLRYSIRDENGLYETKKIQIIVESVV